MGVGNVVPAQFLTASFIEDEELRTLGGPNDKNEEWQLHYSEGGQDMLVAQSPAVVDGIALSHAIQYGTFYESIISAPNPLSGVIPSRNGLMLYKIKQGDTISSLSAQFGISLNTIMWANQGVSKSSLRPGQEIVILPVTGVLHRVVAGESFESIANLYSVNLEELRTTNGNSEAALLLGEKIVIPQGKPLTGKKTALNVREDLLSLPGYFRIPTTGWNWGQTHSYNAVDIANQCGTPIYAAADGLVVEAYASGLNAGYGHFIKLEHPNDTATLYAHLEKLSVETGDLVKQGQLIGTIGNTGNTHGPTGCHLHFEVYGAKNPFAKY